MTTFTLVYSAIHARQDEAEFEAQRKLVSETNNVVSYKHVETTRSAANGEDAYTVGIQFVAPEQTVEHDPQFWLDELRPLVNGTIAEGTLDDHPLF
jgi:hypothetical protein